MTIRDIAISFGFEVDKKSEREAENAIKGLKNLAGKLLGGLAIYLSIHGISSLVEASAEAKALQSQFEQVFGEVEKDASGKLEKIAENTGILTNRIKGSFVQIAAFAKTAGMKEAESLGVAERAMILAADSAAFYDREIKDVTASLQSFLKGNYANDAALGLSATETTRNAAANELYGKSFKDLSEAQKQLTLLKMVEDANKASGALGQAARESDTWVNQLGNLKQVFQDLKAAVGDGFLKPAVGGLKLTVLLLKSATEKVREFTKEGGKLDRFYERTSAYIKRVRPQAERLFKTVSSGIKNGIDFGKRVIDRLGGMENVLKMLSIVAASFFAAMNFGKLLNTAKAFKDMLAGIGKIFGVAAGKVLLIAGAVALLALAVEDFVHFLLGNESVIGAIFDKAGINANEVRQKIFVAWGKVVDFLSETWDFIKEAGQKWIGAFFKLYEKHGEDIENNFKRAWNIIKDFLIGVWTFLSGLAATIFGKTSDDIESGQEGTRSRLMSIWVSVLDALSSLWSSMYETGSAIFNALATIIEVVFGWLKLFWNAWGSDILAYFKVLWDSFGKVLDGFLDVVKGVADFVTAIFTGDWQGAWEAVKNIFSGIWKIITGLLEGNIEQMKLILKMAITAFESISIKIGDAIIGGFNAAIEFITSLPQKAFTWGADFINGLVNGIKSSVGMVVDAVRGVGDKIKSFLHFSVPDEGPLTEYESWMPDFMDGLGKGIEQNQDRVIDKVRNLASGISSLMVAAKTSVSTAAGVAYGNRTSNMTQNVNINNTYSGGTADAQREVSKTMKKSAADATTYMARGLAYARG